MHKNLILGTMNINYQFNSNQKIYNNSDYKEIIETYMNFVGDKSILDSAYYYGNTSTEQTLGEILSELSFFPKISTKVNPWFKNDFSLNQYGQLNKENLEKQFNLSLKNLKMKSVEYLFLHCPDPETPIFETLDICNSLWRREKFNYFGLSNFSLNQLKNITLMCENNDFVFPKIYQGMYNLISRKIEEIFPILEEFNIDFWAYNPLAGGLLTNKYQNIDINNGINNGINKIPKSRFKDNEIYKNIYLKKEIYNHLNNSFYSHNEKCIEYSFQWLQNYSKLRNNDKIIVGVSNTDQLNINLNNLNLTKKYNIEKIKFLNEIYIPIEKFAPNYYY